MFRVWIHDDLGRRVPLVRNRLLLSLSASGAGRELRRSMLACGQCPSCGYSLRGAIVLADWRMHCPECGAAWLFSAVYGVHRWGLDLTSPGENPDRPIDCVTFDGAHRAAPGSWRVKGRGATSPGGAT